MQKRTIPLWILFAVLGMLLVDIYMLSEERLRVVLAQPELPVNVSADQDPAERSSIHEMLGADSQVHNSENVELLGQIGGDTLAVAVQGDLAYIGIGPRLVTVDVSDPADPIILGQTDVLPGVVQDISVVGDHAFVAHGGGLQLVDVSTPSEPIQVWSESWVGGRGIAVDGDYAYSCGGAFLWITDISVLTSPAYVTHFPIPTGTDCMDVLVREDFAYVAALTAGLVVVDVSSPSSPTLAGSCDTVGWAQGVDVAGGRAYVATRWDAGLRVIDISTPSDPTEVSSWGTADVNNVTVVGDYAYLAQLGLTVLDISTPLSPTLAGSYYSPEVSHAEDLAVAGNFAYIAAEDSGLRIVDISDLANLAETGSASTVGDIVDLAAVKSHTYLVEDYPSSRVRILDVANPTNPTVVGTYDEYHGAVAVDAVDNYLYVLDAAESLDVVDVSAPADPIRVGYVYHIDSNLDKVAVAGDHAYLAGGSGVHVVDIYTPTQPVEVGSCTISDPIFVNGIAVSDGHVFIAGWHGLQVVDATNPVSPTQVFSDVSEYAFDVEVVGDYGYLGSVDGHTLQILDVSTPSEPTEIGSYYPGDPPFGVAVQDNRLYVAARYEGLRVVDVSTPSSPAEIGFFDTPGEAEHVAVADGYIYVTDSESGLYVLRLLDSALPGGHLVGSVSDGRGRKLTGAFVGLLRMGEPNYVMTTVTDALGGYGFHGVSVPGMYTVRVTLRDGDNRTRVHYGEHGLLASVETVPIDYQGGTEWFRLDVDFGDPSLDSPIPAGDLDDLAVMFYHSQEVNKFVTTELSEPGFQPVDMIRGFSSEGVYYCPSVEGDECPFARMVNISMDASRISDLNRPMNREYHENFHHVMNDLLGWPFRHAGDVNHGGFHNHCTSDSWTEGWAEFWPCVLRDTLSHPSPELYVWNRGVDSFEINWQVWDHLGLLSVEEFAVASLLWDLYDGKYSRDSDNIDLDLETLWHVLSQATPEIARDMRGIYQLLQQETLVNEDGTVVGATDIDQVFIAHGFFADDGDQEWESGEEAGWGGTPFRRSIFEIPNAYFRVDVEDGLGNPVEGGSCLVEIHLEDSYYDFSYTISLPEASGNLIGLGLPPTRTVASADLTVTYGSAKSEPYTIDNQTYWNNVLSSTTGYAAEHAFVVPLQQIYLPIVSRRD